MEPWHLDDQATIYHGDCLEVLRELPDASVDSVVTDPPYGLEFMGKDWDAPWKGDARAASATTVQADAIGGFQDGSGGNAFSRSRVRTDTRRHGGDMLTANHGFQSWCEDWAAECLRVLKPGGHLLAFGGTRTWHRLAVAIEDAGFEIRDSIAWMYGSGFPKSLDVSKAIDKAAGAERQAVGRRTFADGTQARATAGSSGIPESGASGLAVITAPATPDAARWQGWGTALKPAHEPVVVARKPLTGTVAGNVLEHGTGALNIDGCRIPHGGAIANADGGGQGAGYEAHNKTTRIYGNGLGGIVAEPHTAGRWPANVVLDEDQAAALDQQSGYQKDGVATNRNRAHRKPSTVGYTPSHVDPVDVTYGGGGGASRFFYVAKAPARERPKVDGIAHPTVKPLTLMRWLCRLVTPPGGIVLEPFAGSGTTIEAALLEGFRVVAIEREPDYLPLIAARLERIGQEPDGQLTLDASA